VKKRILALLMATVLVVSLVGCGNTATATPEPTATTSPTPTTEPTKAPVSPVEGGEASIDFEDGNFAFAVVTTPTVSSEASTLSVEEVNGSKVLYVKNTFGKKETYVGFDISAILGDKVADVATIKFDVSVEKVDKFAAASGEVITYTGEGAATKSTIGKWAIYLEKANPKTVTVSVADSFVAGQNNYILIAKTDDVQGAQSFTLDNIKFLDKDGKLIKGDTTVAVAADSPLNSVEETTFVYGMNAVLNTEYQGDWTTGVGIPASFFAGVTTPVNVVLQCVVLNPADWAGIFATDANWAKPTEDYFIGLGTESAGYIHFQGDGAIILDDLSLTTLKFTITPEAAKAYAENGGMFFPGYNLQVISATVSDSTYQTSNNVEYQGDWTTGVGIPAEMFANATGPVTVSLDCTVLNPSDWAGIFATDANWAKPTEDYFVGLGTESAGYIHFQGDGAIILDDLSLTTLTFTITAAAAKAYAENGGMFFPGYNLQVIGATVSHEIHKCVNNVEYQGDWTTGVGIPAEFFAGVTNPVNVVLDCVVLNPADWAGIFATDANWAKPTEDYFVGLGTESAGYIHFQGDGAIILDDLGLTTLSFTITPEAAKAYAENGGMFFPGYNLQVMSATVSESRLECSNNVEYQGDWTTGVGIPAGFFAGATGTVNVTLTGLVLNTADWAGFFCTDANWAKPTEDYFVGVATEAAGYIHFQGDGALILDDLSLTSITFSITADAAKAYAENGGMFFPGYNFQVISAVVTK